MELPFPELKKTPGETDLGGKIRGLVLDVMLFTFLLDIQMELAYASLLVAC